MTGSNKNNNDMLSDFLRYRNKKMTDKERNAFERNLQKDPFLEEAFEGFEDIDAGLAEKDIIKLRGYIKKRTTRRQKSIWYRIAASVAVLMILSSVYIYINRQKPDEQITEIVSPARPEENEEIPVQEETISLSEKNESPPPQSEKGKKSAEAAPIPEPKASKKGETIQKGRTAQKEEPIEEKIPEVEQDAAVAAIPEDNDIQVSQARFKNAPKTVMAKETAFTDSKKEDTIKDYFEPIPLIGREKFEQYLKENIRRPDTITSGQRVVVVLNFIVDPIGNIDSIKVIRSPGKIFSDEAIRLIKDGPAWKSAVKNGKPVSDTVKISIVFN